MEIPIKHKKLNKRNEVHGKVFQNSTFNRHSLVPTPTQSASRNKNNKHFASSHSFSSSSPFFQWQVSKRRVFHFNIQMKFHCFTSTHKFSHGAEKGKR
jgi:hypothetical protein